MEARGKPETREKILDACDRIMGRHGFRKMSMDDLALEAGVSKRTLYMYFQDKEDVGLSSIARVSDLVYKELVSIAAGFVAPSIKLRRMLTRRVMARIDAVKDYYVGLDQLFEVVRPGYMARRQFFFERELEILVQVLREGSSAGVFTFEDEVTTGRSMLLATNAFIPYSLSVKELGNPEELEKQLDQVIELLLHGLDTQPRWRPITTQNEETESISRLGACRGWPSRPGTVVRR